MEQAELAIGAGAEFLISPNTNPQIIRYTASQNVISMPGAYTPTEIDAAYAAGADAAHPVFAPGRGSQNKGAILRPA